MTTVCAKLGTPTFLIAIKDYNFQNDGEDFLNSGAGITRGLHTVEREMVAIAIVRTTEFYLFGCLDVSTDGHLTFTPATARTFFDGGANEQ